MVKNEILSLPESIMHTKDLADEICVVDTGSTDGTVGYLKEMQSENTLKFAEFKWCDDFSAARNASLDMATGDWILILDADEWIYLDQFETIRKLMSDPNIDIWEFSILSFMQDPHWVKKPVVIKGFVERMFRNGKGFKYEGIVHNKLMFNGQLSKNSKCAINNFKFREKRTYKEKAAANKILLDKKIIDQGWTFLNCVHYADIYRGLWTWFGDVKDGNRAVHYLDMALKIKHDRRMVETKNSILQGVRYAKSRY